ncbi:RluA family pseudouridine synthase [Silvibacterium acidisoli]|uniref:RluA family pseudouridine synthase n=1 Tax=Acidobacteriaceae bacterium ZG23-2 TaxID=2883246 RepID=UPI00406C1AA2
MSETYNVVPEDAGNRLDAWLVRQLTSVSRSRVQLLLSEGKVLVDGAAAKPSFKLKGGETVEITGPAEPPPLRAIPESIPLDIVYEDKDLSVINKPAGMMVHAGAGATEDERNRGTLVNALLAHYQSLSSAGGPMRPGIVHRLDKQTSGLIIVARNDAAHLKLSEMFSQRRMRKTYLALVHGSLKQDKGTINAAIARDSIRRTRMTTKRDEGARNAISHYTVVERITSRFGQFTLVSVRIETGRTHQIRVHLSSIGHPVVGDTLYGAPARIVLPGPKKKSAPEPESIALDRNFLHAAELEFEHPKTGKMLDLKAGLPLELTSFVEELRTR